MPEGVQRLPPSVVAGTCPPPSQWPATSPQAFQPWDDAPLDYRCAAMNFDWRFDAQGEFADPDMPLPLRMARAAPRRRAEWIAGRRCAGEAVRLLTGLHGCPGMAPDRAPIWPEGVTGSISHCGNSAIAIVARAGECRGIGIDIEHVLDEAEAGEIALQALTPAERRRFGIAIDPFLVTLAFSAKESLFKALYPTLRRPLAFHSSELVAWNAAAGTALLRLDDALARAFAGDHDIDVRFIRLGGLAVTSVAIPR